MQSGSAVSRSEVNAPMDGKLSQFHRELTETCTDVMARYAFGNFSPLPHRFVYHVLLACLFQRKS